MDPGFPGEDRRPLTTTPWGLQGAGLQGVWRAQALEVRCQRARACGRSTGSWALHQPLGAVVGKALHPLAERGLGTGPRLRDGLEALAFDDVAYGWGTPEHPGLLGLVQERV
jgi:hypothetical protein